MDLNSVEEQKRQILELLKDDSVTTIILVGDAGVGKTWMEKKIRDCAISEGLCFAALWISMNIKHDTTSLYKNIGHQLSILPTTEELEDDDVDKEEEENLDNLKKKILVKLGELWSSTYQENRFLLLILDDEGSKMDEEKDLSELKAMLCVNQQYKLKLLISRRNNDDGEIAEDTRRVMKVEPLAGADPLTLLKKRIAKRVFEFSSFGQLSEAIAEKSMGLPAAIMLMAEALNHMVRHDSGLWTLESALEEAAGYEETAKNVSPLLCCAYDMLPRGTMTDCFWHCQQFFNKYGGVHYNELITHWIMEGYFGPVNHVERAYEEGHCVLMELLDRRMIKIQEDNVVMVEGATQSITDYRHGGFAGTASLGLTSVVQDGQWKGPGRIAPTDGMIKTLCSDKKWKKVSTLLIDGSRLSREVSEIFFERMKGLEVLAVFDPRLKSLPLSLSQLDKLLVLVLRGCDLLDNIDHISKLKTLTVLEISGATSLEIIPDNFFEHLTQIQSLNLSRSRLKNLPSTLSKLSELRWLILRHCFSLENLPKLNALKNLEVLDLSDASSFSNFQEKSFAIFQKLQTLNLSRTQIARLPFISNLKELTHLLLRGCKRLSRLPKLEQLLRLQILDLSDAVKLREINNVDLKILDLSGTLINHSPPNINNLSELYLRGCSELKVLPSTEDLTDLKLLDASGASSLEKFKDKSFTHLSFLRCINLSKTSVTNLPSLSNLHNLRHLLLRDCLLLQKLPEFEGLIRLKELDLSGCVCLDKLPRLDALSKLEVLDLSGCSALATLEDQSFVHMSHLRKLNLSKTKVENLLSLSSSHLCHLVLGNCINLKALPQLKFLSKLEVLDLCGASTPTEIQSEFLEHLTHLQNLNLSQIILKEFSFVSKLTNLRKLSLKGCLGLVTVPFLEDLTRLEVLDLSETAVVSLPTLDKLSHLCELLLSGCSSLDKLPSLKSLTHLEVLDLSGSGVKEFPYEISELTHLKRLDLRDLKVIQEVDWGRIKRLPEELNWGQFGISNNAGVIENGKKPSILVNGTKLFQILKEYPNLLNTCLDRIFFCVCPPKEQANDVDLYHQIDEIILNDAYFYIKQFPHCSVRSIELRGFKSFPAGVEDVLEHAEYVSLVENGFMQGLSNLGSGTLKLKGCWLEGCTKMENIFCNETDVKFGENLEIFWLSNLVNLRGLFCDTVECMNFKNLQHLYLDCCPLLEDVFPSTSQLENLEILRVQFCDKLKTVFKCDGDVKRELPNLKELHLLELPELTSIGAILPSGAKITAIACPNLKL